MVAVKETERAFVFMCHACLEVRNLSSIQVKSKPRYKQEVKRQLGREGRLMTEAPKVNRRFIMDETLRRKNGR